MFKAQWFYAVPICMPGIEMFFKEAYKAAKNRE